MLREEIVMPEGPNYVLLKGLDEKEIRQIADLYRYAAKTNKECMDVNNELRLVIRCIIDSTASPDDMEKIVTVAKRMDISDQISEFCKCVYTEFDEDDIITKNTYSWFLAGWLYKFNDLKSIGIEDIFEENSERITRVELVDRIIRGNRKK